MQHLSKRERQIMDVIYMLGRATAIEVRQHLPEDVGDDSVRKLIRILEEKGHLSHQRIGRSHLYAPRLAAEEARRQAMLHLLRTFFSGSASKAVSTLLDVAGGSLSAADVSELQALIKQAKQKGR